MLTDSDKQVAALAVSRYGADRTRVYETLAAVRRAQTVGRQSDFLDALVEQKLLTAAQAHKLRFALDDTQIDPELDQPAAEPEPDTVSPARNGTVAADQEDLLGPGAGLDLRMIGPYRILASLGEGGMGAVYRAYHEAEDRYVAIKVLSDLLARNQAYVERFHREAQNVARLNHPNIVRSLGAGHDPESGKHYLVLEYVDGESAQNLLERLERLRVGDAVHLALDVARALEHAHSRRIIHRDIKPDNILLTQSGVAKLSDLGLAKKLGEASNLTATRQGFGTPYYMPYEQAVNAKQADGRSDIFALGATLYHLVTGEVPFQGDSHLEIVEKKELGEFPPASSLCPDVPPELDRILKKMMARHPRDRYRMAADLIVDLERSRLAASIPSFVDSELAMQDPLVRARLQASAQATQPDLPAPGKESARPLEAGDWWYLRYQNREGRPVKGRLTEAEVRNRLASGRLNLGVEAARAPDGEFRPLSAYPEFAPAPAEEAGEAGQGPKPAGKRRRVRPPADEDDPKGPPRKWWWPW